MPMHRLWIKREHSDGLEWSRIKIADIIPDFFNNIAQLDIASTKDVDIDWRILNSKTKGAGTLTLWVSTDIEQFGDPLVKISLPKGQNTAHDFMLFSL